MDSDGNDIHSIKLAFDKQNEILQDMLGIMKKPENPFFKVLAIAGAIVGVLGIIQVIDIFLSWF